MDTDFLCLSDIDWAVYSSIRYKIIENNSLKDKHILQQKIIQEKNIRDAIDIYIYYFDYFNSICSY